MIDPKELKLLASYRRKEFRELFRMLKRRKPKNLDKLTHKFHNEVFAKLDCLDCANCCKSISPMITDRDIQRISSGLKMKPSEFTEKYLDMDEEQDYVFKNSPCPFLMTDNYCSIYEIRPKACREYPHTDRKRFVQILDLTLKNTATCPAVFEVVEGLKREFGKG
jgi:Fe-S-cluster containining protein